jgi:hypothetical protein
MADLVSEMPEQRSIGLMLHLPLRLAIHVVRFGHVDGDEAVVVPGQHPAPVAIEAHSIAQELEFQAPNRVLPFAHERQLQTQDGIHRTPLRRFQLGPGRVTLRRVETRNGLSEGAGSAE